MNVSKRKKQKFYSFLKNHSTCYKVANWLWPKAKKNRLNMHVFGTSNRHAVKLNPVAEKIYQEIKRLEENYDIHSASLKAK